MNLLSNPALNTINSNHNIEKVGERLNDHVHCPSKITDFTLQTNHNCNKMHPFSIIKSYGTDNLLKQIVSTSIEPKNGEVYKESNIKH